jgi:putative chitinase
MVAFSIDKFPALPCSNLKGQNMNLTTFFAYARRAPFGGRLTQAQIDGMTAILNEWDRRKLLDKRWLAYMLATSVHETGATMQPIKERGGNNYLSKYDTGTLAKILGNTPQADGDGQKFLGRGLVQITGRDNYRKFGIEAKPDEALKMTTAVRILFDGMIKGMFTGRKLSDYFGQIENNPVGARSIVNGKDKAKLIAGYHKNFLDAIEAAQDAESPADVTLSAAKADDVSAGQSGTAITTVLVPAATGLAVPIVTGINNVYALIFAVALLAVSCIAGFMFVTGKWSVNRSNA